MARLDSIGGALSETLRGLVRRGGQRVILADSDRLDGKTCLVTGANRGLGRGIVVGMARRGARVIMACRSGIPAAGEAVRRISGSDRIEMLRVDLADLGSVNILADALAARTTPLDVVVANAGLVTREARPTHQGFEQMFGVNYLAHALLIRRLLSDGVVPNSAFAERGNAESMPRIVIVSSEIHRSADPIDFERLGEFTPFGLSGTMPRYAHSKLLNVMMAAELARRLRVAGRPEVAVHSLCPGPVSSDLGRDAPWMLKPVTEPLIKLAFRSPSRAARPVIYLACARALAGQTGKYLHGMILKPASEAAVDADNGRRLWEATDRLLAGYA